MNTKQHKGRSFLGTFFLLAIGFAVGFYNVEILAFAMRALNFYRER